ncbi:MAG: DUF1697 domain-containing protein [Alkalibacterium sp.]|nr:DUF1697 domain-containing protein [Alkalibacterium sp.]
MSKYVIYLRGINVGGKNKIRMADLREKLTDEGFENVQTYIQSGNIVLESELGTKTIEELAERIIIDNFEIDSTRIKVLALEYGVYQRIIEETPDHFGSTVEGIDYRYDVLFPMGISVEEVMKDIQVRENIDTVWHGKHAIYYRRPGPSHPDYTKSALSRLAQKAVYQSITIRNWKTTLKLWEMLNTE